MVGAICENGICMSWSRMKRCGDNRDEIKRREKSVPHQNTGEEDKKKLQNRPLRSRQNFLMNSIARDMAVLHDFQCGADGLFLLSSTLPVGLGPDHPLCSRVCQKFFCWWLLER